MCSKLGWRLESLSLRISVITACQDQREKNISRPFFIFFPSYSGVDSCRSGCRNTDTFYLWSASCFRAFRAFHGFLGFQWRQKNNRLHDGSGGILTTTTPLFRLIEFHPVLLWIRWRCAAGDAIHLCSQRSNPPCKINKEINVNRER